MFYLGREFRKLYQKKCVILCTCVSMEAHVIVYVLYLCAYSECKCVTHVCIFVHVQTFVHQSQKYG